MAVTAVPCNDLVNDAPVIHPACEGDCRACPTRGTPAIVDGTYVLTNLVNYTDDCASLATASIRGKVRVAGNVMDMVIEQPTGAVGDTSTSRMRYGIALVGGVLTVDWTCPPSEIGSQVVNYFSDGLAVRFSILPGIHGDAVFALR